MSLPPIGDATATLFAKAREGDSRALDALYARYMAPLKSWARGRLPTWARDLTDTDDMVQETLLHSLRRVDAFEPRYQGSFLYYLRQGLDNRICDEVRRAKRRPGVRETAGAALDDRPSPLEETLGMEKMERFGRALARLKPDDREAIVARIELGLSFQQVAEALGKPSADAARVATSRAIVRLAKEMARG